MEPPGTATSLTTPHLSRQVFQAPGLKPGAPLLAEEIMRLPARRAYTLDSTARERTVDDHERNRRPGDITTTVPWRDFHHVDLVTQDLDATVSFYGDLLGMDVGDVMGRTARGGRSQHRFIRPGTGETWGLHFFESSAARPVTKTAEAKFSPERLGCSTSRSHHQTNRPDCCSENACARTTCK